jgi:hypothetical protein
MGNPDKFDGKTTCFYNFPGPDDVEVSVQFEFFELLSNEADGQGGAVDWDHKFGKEIGKCPDMIFMTVGEDNRFDFIETVSKPGYVRNNQINTKHGWLWKHEATIYDDYVIPMLVNHHVEANFAKTPERDDSEVIDNMRALAMFCRCNFHGGSHSQWEQ